MITQEQVHTFIEEGAVVLDGLIPSHIIDGAARAMDTCYAPHTDKESGIVGYPLGAGFEALYQHENLERAAQAVLGCEAVEIASSAVLHTSPNATSWGYNTQSEHVDVQFNRDEWLASPRRIAFTFMIFLDDVPADRAPTVVRPRSHRQIGDYYGSEMPFRDAPVNMRDLPALDWNDPVPLTGRKGQVAVSTTAMIHAGSLNASDRPRKVMFVVFKPSGLEIRFNMNRIAERLAFMETLHARFRPDRRHLVASTIRELAALV